MQAPSSAERGIGRYARDLTTAILAADPDGEYLLYAVEGMPTEGIPQAPNARVVMIPPFMAEATSCAVDNFLWERGNLHHLDALLILSPFQSHTLGMSGLRKISVVYDLIPEIMPDDYSTTPIYRRQYERYLKAVRNYAAILTMSESCKYDLVTRRDFDPSKITVVGAAANPAFRPAATPAERAEDRAILRAMGIYDPGYVLNVGHEDPRKGTDPLIRAYAMLSEELQCKRRLILAYGASESHKYAMRSLAGSLGLPPVAGDPDLLHELGMLPRVHFTGWCDERKLAALYRNAAVMAFPSQYEGFGLPILEAMACGCPVLAANNSSQPEITGSLLPLICDYERPDAIAQWLRWFLEPPTSYRNQEMVSAVGLQRARAFTWEACADRALAAIRGC